VQAIEIDILQNKAAGKVDELEKWSRRAGKRVAVVRRALSM